MKTSTQMTLSAAMIALSISAVAQNLSPLAATKLESFDKGNTIALKSTKLPFEKQVPDVVSSDVAKSPARRSDDAKPSYAPRIDTSEEWGDWSSLGTGTYSRGNKKFLYSGSDYSFPVSLEIRTSTVSGHENLHQIKVDGAFGDNDLIFWWDSSEQLTQHDLTAEDIADTYTISGYSTQYKSISVDNAVYTPAQGTFRFRVCYSKNEVGEETDGLTFNETIVLDNAQTYNFDILATKSVYANNENQAHFSVSASDNLKTIRYYVVPEIDIAFDDVVRTLDEQEFIKLDYKTVDISNATVDVDIIGYQRNFVYFQVLNSDGVPVYYLSEEVVSTQDDSLNWTSIGYGTLSDQDLLEYYVEDATEPYEWKVELQQCASDESLYRLVNPYTNENSPFRNIDFNADYLDSYTSYCDLSQNYYIYFRVGNNNNPTKGTVVYSYVFPSGLYFKDVETGALSYLYAQKFTNCSEDHKVASSYSSFEFPSFVDFSFTLKSAGNNVVDIVPASQGITLKYEIFNLSDEEIISLKSVPSDLSVDLNSESLNKDEEYRLVVKSYNLNGDERTSKEFYFNLGMSDWEYVGSGTYTYTAYYDTTCQHDIYRRHSLSNENHEQYKIELWMFKSNTNFIIDVPDITAVDDEGRVPISVPIANTKIINSDYGEIRAADAYTYSGLENLSDMSYYEPDLGEFHMYNVYFVDNGYFDVSYELFKLVGFPNLTVQDGGQTRSDGGYYQSFYVDMANVAYVTYGVYDALDYNSEEAIDALKTDANAKLLTMPTTLHFDQLGEYILAVAAYNDSGEVVKTATGSFYNINFLNMDDWTYIGQGFIYDGWILPGYTSESNQDYGWYVDAYSNKQNPYIIGLLNPYIDSRCTLTDLNINHVVESMMAIDLSDTDFIIISQQYSGFKADGYGDISIGNYEGGFSEYYTDKDYIREIMKAKNLKATTYDAEQGLITIPQCIIGYTGSDFGYTWANPQTGYIFLPDGYVLDVQSITADDGDSDAPVEYFNLQGVRISNPEHGLYICRKGSSVTKVIR